MENQINVLKRKRAANKGVITKILNTIESTSYYSSQSIPSRFVDEAKSQLSMLKCKYTDVQRLDTDISGFIDDERELDEEVSRMHTYYNKIELEIAKLDTKIKKYKSVTNKQNISEFMHLPKLQLPIFNGERSQWFPFWDSFNASIHSNTQLNEIQKFTYLLSCLNDSVKKCISGLSITARNYESAITQLTDRYGDKDECISSLVKKFNEVTCSSDSVKNMKNFQDEVKSLQNSLINLNVNPDTYEVFVVPILMSKLPNTVKYDMIKNKKLSTQNCFFNNLKDFLYYIQIEISIREEASLCEVTKQKLNINSSNNGFTPTISALTLQDKVPKRPSTQNYNDIQKNCPFCNKPGHSAVNCLTKRTVKERRDIAKANNLCYMCLKSNHSINNCYFKAQCPLCNKYHHKSLCEATNTNRNYKKDFNATNNNFNASHVTDTTRSEGTVLYLRGNPQVVMPMAKATLLTPNGIELTVRILFDTASNKSFILNSLITYLNLEVTKKEKLKLRTFGSDKVELLDSHIITANIKKFNSINSEIFSIKVNTVDKICTPQPSINTNILGMREFDSLDLADSYDLRDQDRPIDILLGADQYYDFIGSSTIRSDKGPVAVESKLGWIIMGKLNISTENNNNVVETNHVDIQDNFSKFWDLEHLGIQKNDFNNKHNFLQNVSYTNNRYSVDIPWKYERDHIDLPSNYANAHRRLETNIVKLKKAKLLTEYDRIIQEQHKNDIIEPVEDQHSNTAMIHYLPHQAVLKPENETTKLRIVFDASAKAFKGAKSLNEFVDQGQCTIPLILDILLKFRFQNIALISDVSKAFLQIGINSVDRNVLRFLWLSDCNDDNSKLITYRFRRVTFGLKCSPSILQEVIKLHLSKFENTNGILNNIYVDNLITGAQNISEAHKIYTKSRDIFKLASMDLCQWNSNSKQLLEHIPTNNCQAKTVNSVLGISWDNIQDTFIFDFTFLKKQMIENPTKRHVLRQIAQIFDPLGLLSPVTVIAKSIFQKLCILKIDWDCQIPVDESGEWKSFILQLIKTVVIIPRKIKKPDKLIKSYELHGFSDASKLAFACCVYLKTKYHDDTTDVKLITAKSRISPINPVCSIPKLELLGALILSRLMHLVSKLYHIDDIYCWSDSEVVLCWIKNDKMWPRFIQNRVVEIRNNVHAHKWLFCPGVENPADINSRGLMPLELGNNILWFFGPVWISKDKSYWPVKSYDVSLNFSNEIKTENPVITLHTLSAGSVINIDKYSSWYKVLEILAYVRRFINNLKLKKTDRILVNYLTLTEIDNANKMLIKHFQNIDYTLEIMHITTNSKPTELNKQLHLLLDIDKILRSKGRINNSEMGMDSKNPILVPRVKHIETLLIREAHTKVFHSGVSATLAKLRESYWIVSGRQKVKSTLAKCVICSKVQGFYFRNPPIAPLPIERVTYIRAFSTVGVDYFGPLYVCCPFSDSMYKTYGCLFTCTATRAVHIELVLDLTCHAFILCLKRFISRRGIPNIISDNATNFKAASRLLSNHSVSGEVQRYAVRNNIKWQFITETAPWEGGFYERLIGTIKSCLKKVIGKNRLTYDKMNTLLIEIEAVINSRPITYVSADNENILTPAHFLILQRMTENEEITQQPSQITLSARYQVIQKYLNRFWNVWNVQYLTSLREFKLTRSLGVPQEPKVNQVVLIRGENGVPRFKWKLGKIINLHIGRDGAIRAVTLKLAGDKIIKRPLKNIIPLER